MSADFVSIDDSSWFRDNCLLAASPNDRKRKMICVSIYKDTNYTKMIPPSGTNHFSEALPPDTITLGLGFNYEFEGTQSLYYSFIRCLYSMSAILFGCSSFEFHADACSVMSSLLYESSW